MRGRSWATFVSVNCQFYKVVGVGAVLSIETTNDRGQWVAAKKEDPHRDLVLRLAGVQF